MNIVVCMKQVPDTTAKKELGPDFCLNREALDSVINPFDEYAIEEALRLRDAHGGEVVILTMGPPSADDTIRKALAMGADRGVLLTDPALAGSDWSGTCTALSAALQRLPFDLLLTGMESTDARSGVVPGGLSELLGVPLLTQVQKLDVRDRALHVERQVPGGHQVLEAPLPCVVSVVKGVNEPRYPSLKGIMAAKRKDIQRLSVSDLGLEPGKVGLAGARTRVTAADPRPDKQPGEVLKPDTPEEAAQLIADFLQANRFI